MSVLHCFSSSDSWLCMSSSCGASQRWAAWHFLTLGQASALPAVYHPAVHPFYDLSPPDGDICLEGRACSLVRPLQMSPETRAKYVSLVTEAFGKPIRLTVKTNHHTVLLSTSATEINFSLSLVNYQRTQLYNCIESNFNSNKNKDFTNRISP